MLWQARSHAASWARLGLVLPAEMGPQAKALMPLEMPHEALDKRRLGVDSCILYVSSQATVIAFFLWLGTVMTEMIRS